MVLGEVCRVSGKYVVMQDPVIAERQHKIGKFFYSMDRGNEFRKVERIQEILGKEKGLELRKTVRYRTFPGIYDRGIFVLQKVTTHPLT